MSFIIRANLKKCLTEDKNIEDKKIVRITLLDVCDLSSLTGDLQE